MGCSTTTVKTSSITFYVILAVLAIGSIVWIAFNPDAIDENLAIGAYVIYSLIVFLAFLGCFAALRESVCLAATCAVFFLILAILQIVATCIDMNDNESRNGLATVERAWERNEMDTLQLKHECCGKSSLQDYILLGKTVPASCYAAQNSTTEQAAFTVGCATKLQEYYESKELYFTIDSWLLIAFELLGFLLAVFLVINFRNKQRRLQF